jgi:hypothetical protein
MVGGLTGHVSVFEEYIEYLIDQLVMSSETGGDRPKTSKRTSRTLEVAVFDMCILVEANVRRDRLVVSSLASDTELHTMSQRWSIGDFVQLLGQVGDLRDVSNLSHEINQL